jgi:hypothetical protein
MAEVKTKPTDLSVSAFIKAIEDVRTRKDCQAPVKRFTEATGAQPRMWGPSIVGFQSCHYRYASGKEGEWAFTGFLPRKPKSTLYIMSGYDRHEDLQARLGQQVSGTACLYVRSLDNLDLAVLKRPIRASERHMAKSSGRA